MLKAWPAFTAFLDDGRICLSNNAAEQALRGIAPGRKSWLFAGSDRGGQRIAFMLSLIATAKLNDIAPPSQACRCARPHRGYPTEPVRQPTPLELATQSGPASGCLNRGAHRRLTDIQPAEAHDCQCHRHTALRKHIGLARPVRSLMGAIVAFQDGKPLVLRCGSDRFPADELSDFGVKKTEPDCAKGAKHAIGR